MKLSIIASLFLMLITTSSNAQLNNSKTVNVKIYGNCGMCEKTIETAGNEKKVALVDWNKDSKMATITYDSLKTTKMEILKRVALAGYDSDNFLAPEDTYNALAGCCKYDRAQPISQKIATTDNDMEHMNHVDAKDPLISKDLKSESKPPEETTVTNPFQSVFNDYFSLKDALISSDPNKVSKAATMLLTSINSIKMSELEMDVHMVWMNKLKDLKANVQTISESSIIDEQRKSFIALSDNIYNLVKISPLETPTYFQHCPMANDGKGANWLSQETEIKNPYYGAAMLSCGKTMETLK